MKKSSREGIIRLLDRVQQSYREKLASGTAVSALEKDHLKSLLVDLYDAIEAFETGQVADSSAEKTVESAKFSPEPLIPEPEPKVKTTETEENQTIQESDMENTAEEAVPVKETLAEITAEVTDSAAEDEAIATDDSDAEVTGDDSPDGADVIPLHERFAKPTESLVDRLARNKQADLQDSIDLNQRIMFVSKLFGNDAVAYGEAITSINEMAEFDKAESYLQELGDRHGWVDEPEVSNRFLEIVRKRFSQAVGD